MGKYFAEDVCFVEGLFDFADTTPLGRIFDLLQQHQQQQQQQPGAPHLIIVYSRVVVPPMPHGTCLLVELLVIG